MIPGYNAVAQCSHFFIAATVVLVIVRLGSPLAVAGLAVLVWSIPKEFVYDLLVEGDSLYGSSEDFIWYVIGDLAALAFVFLT